MDVLDTKFEILSTNNNNIEVKELISALKEKESLIKEISEYKLKAKDAEITRLSKDAVIAQESYDSVASTLRGDL